MPEQIRAAEKMRERTITSQYRKLIGNFNKFADNGKRSFIRLEHGLTDYTIERLKLEGFTLTPINENGFKAYKIEW